MLGIEINNNPNYIIIVKLTSLSNCSNHLHEKLPCDTNKSHFMYSVTWSGNRSMNIIETEQHKQMPAESKIKVYNYHTKPLRPQIEDGVLINNARCGELLNSRSEMTRGGEIPRLVIMVGDKEVHNSVVSIVSINK